jgi:hypothetical protein
MLVGGVVGVLVGSPIGGAASSGMSESRGRVVCAFVGDRVGFRVLV